MANSKHIKGRVKTWRNNRRWAAGVNYDGFVEVSTSPTGAVIAIIVAPQTGESMLAKVCINRKDAAALALAILKVSDAYPEDLIANLDRAKDPRCQLQWV